MVRQTVFLFLRALIFGILINIGLQLTSDVPLDKHEVATPHQIQDNLQPSSKTNTNTLEQADQ